MLTLATALWGCGPRLVGGFEDGGESAGDSPSDSGDDGETGPQTKLDIQPDTGDLPPAEFVQIAAGNSHVCGLWINGRVYCWGGGWLGQLGNNGFENASTPQQVVGLEAVRLGAGKFHGCAVQAWGEALCWGHDINGSLGNGGSGDSAVPLPVLGLTGPVLEIGGGPAHHHSCATTVDGDMLCWGDNDHGQLGNGTTTPAATAQLVIGLPAARTFAIGYIHSCALDFGGQVYCWGWNPHGLVDAALPADAPFLSPWPKLGLDDVVGLSAGNHHACALHEDGRVSCWGYEGEGQLGDGSELEHGEPLPVAGLDDAVAISGGTTHECALRSGGEIVCWGSNYFGQLGDGTTESSPVPVEVVGIDDATQIAVGDGFTCALSSSRNALCWGSNGYGQLGDGTTEDSLVPVAVVAP